MLSLSSRQKWVSFELAGIKLLLSPLDVPLRARLSELASEKTSEKGPGRFKTKFNVARYNDLVAEHCIHGWEGVTQAQPDGSEKPAECTVANRQALMRNDAVADFVFSQVSGVALQLVEEVKEAGNVSGG